MYSVTEQFRHTRGRGRGRKNDFRLKIKQITRKKSYIVLVYKRGASRKYIDQHWHFVCIIIILIESITLFPPTPMGVHPTQVDHQIFSS